ncbi:MAG: HAD family hydrolase [Roseburia sp.]|nr:HAD family hydrolase [Anaeroplasma bactoclasticum]MCM1195473.1 HAD family hydrolase [Roseburia sp.]MCM1555951.1 HAD family hydrolase [Anaeroplasma bactoclasticum]
MKYKMVIFDLDGTILNTLKDLQEACNYALKKYKLSPITLEQTKSYIGNGIRNLLISASHNNEHIDDILLDFKEYYSKHYNDFTTRYEGIDTVFGYCKEKNILIGVLTNKVEDIARKIVEEHFPNQMEFIFGEVLGRPRKPDAFFLLSIIEKYGYKKEEVLYVGDSEVDVKTSLNANIDGVFVAYGFRSREVLSLLTTRIVDTPLELLKYIGEM